MSFLSQLSNNILPRRSAADRQAASPKLVLVIVCAGVVLASLDLFIVNVALPQMGRDFHLRAGGLADLSWVLNAYAIVYASFLVLFGRMAERYPREQGFLAGVAVFVVASAACGAATSLPMLVAFRIVQALGAALLTPTSLGLILAAFPAERRYGAVRTWTAVGGLAAAAGPVIGGLLVALSWRWVFLVNVPVGVLALIVGWRRLPRVPGQPVSAPDALGAILVTGGVGALVLGLVKGGGWGWGDARTVAALALGLVGLGLFALHCARSRNPLIDRELFKLRPLTGSSVVALLFMASFGGMLLSRVLWAQDVWHWSALQTGLAIAPGPFMVPVFSFLVAGRLIARFGPAKVIAAGSTIFAIGVAWWALAMGLRPDYARDMLGGDAAHGSRRGADDADVHGHRGGRTTAALLCHRLGDDQHVAPDRTGHRGGRADRRARLPAHPGGHAPGLPAGLLARGGDRPGGRSGRTRLALGPAAAGYCTACFA